MEITETEVIANTAAEIETKKTCKCTKWQG